MRKINICDVTLREATKERNMSFKEKLEVAKKLEELNVDVIEVGPLLEDQTEAVLVRTMCSFVKNATISCLATPDKDSILKAANVIANAKNKRIGILIPASSMQMEYICHKKAPKMLELMEEMIGYALSLEVSVEVVFTDATRSEEEFLNEAIILAIKKGAESIVVEDSAGIMFPIEFRNWIESLYQKIGELKNINFGVTCNDSLSMGVACAFCAVKAGTNMVKTSIFGGVIPPLDKIVKTFSTIGDKLNISTGVDITKLTRIVEGIVNEEKLVSPKKEIRNTEYLDPEITESDLVEIIAKRGYELSLEDNGKVFETYQRVACKKKVSLKELEVIIANTALQVPITYKLDTYVINSGNKIFSTASIVLLKNNEATYGLSKGDGPIDAAFLAIEGIIGHHFELEDFQVQAATEGREAIGEALVKIRYNGKLYSGRGISTDIVGASIRAYIAAVNKIVYEEESL